MRGEGHVGSMMMISDDDVGDVQGARAGERCRSNKVVAALHSFQLFKVLELVHEEDCERPGLRGERCSLE